MLEFGVDVAEKQVRRGYVVASQHRREGLEDVELRIQRDGRVEVFFVGTGPPERLAVGGCEAGGIDAFRMQHLNVFWFEVVADDSYHARRREVAG